jgi:hypothetical protein
MQMRADFASATSVPWIDANGWRFLRGTTKALYEKVPQGRAALAAAEAFAYGVDAVIEPAPSDLPALSKMLAFLGTIEAAPLPVLANIGVIDDGTEVTEEVLNLLARRNLLFRVVSKPDPSLGLNIRIGTAPWTKEVASDPNDFAARVREKITDPKRLLRLYGSYTVIAHLRGSGSRARLHLLNYGRQPVRDLRVRVLGSYKGVRLVESNQAGQQAADITWHDGGTELTIPSLATYAVVDLEKQR